ncbi:MAG: C1 family peptidase [Lewinellaceae bacterium]|nr:C1 family peptidase [Lewinellaceae bacterium]
MKKTRVLPLLICGLLAGPAAPAQPLTALETPAQAGSQGTPPPDCGRQTSLLAYCPTPSDQGYAASSAAHAIANAMTIRLAFQCRLSGKQQVDRMRFSAAYIYNQVKQGETCDAGAYLTDGLDLARKQGVCREATFPGSRYACSRLPGEAERREAGRFRIRGYSTIFRLDAGAEDKINATLSALDWNNPVIAGLVVPPTFPEISPGSYRGQAAVVVDYDEKKEEFLLMNSYGPDWGEGGFVRMRFEDYGKLARYAYIISLGRMDCGLFSE